MSTLGFMNVYTKRQRIATLTRQIKGKLTNLNQYIDLDWMYFSWSILRKDGAVGIDQITAEAYEKNLEKNLVSLLDRFHAGTYVAPPVRRTYIPKIGGVRPLGIPCLEDKLLQTAVNLVLNEVYEQLFLDSSWGYRPGRGAKQAAIKLKDIIMEFKGGIILEVDIKAFFNNLDHSVLRTALKHKINDGVILRAIDKWLTAGVMEDGSLSFPTSGTPQGGSISPVLSNIYLHYVLDLWFEKVVKPEYSPTGRVELIRYADDFVIVFRSRKMAEEVLNLLRERMKKFGLELHPDKTRIIPFLKPFYNRRRRPKEMSETFNFLGFTYVWGIGRATGYWTVKMLTDRTRTTRGLRRISDYCRKFRNEELEKQFTKLRNMVKGHANYFGIPGNWSRVRSYYWHAKRIWHKWLSRRSDKGYMRWENFNKMFKRIEEELGPWYTGPTMWKNVGEPT